MYQKLVLLGLLLSLLRFIDGAVDVYIDNERCQTSSQSISCPNIEHFAREFFNYSDVTIHVTDQVKVAALVVFHGNANLSIIGERSEPKPTLMCNNTPACHQFGCAGLQFIDVKTLTIANVQIVGCGGDHLFDQTINIYIFSAVFINRCRDVAITNVDIRESNQNSLFIENTSGNVFIETVHVHNNVLNNDTVKPKRSFAGGVQIYILESTNESQYIILDCRFYNITTPDYTELDPRVDGNIREWIGYGLGGGISIIFNESSSNHSILVSNCVFEDIIAPWGSGLYFDFLEGCHLNSVTIVNTTFQYCTAIYSGGGLGIGFAQPTKHESVDNHVIVHNSTFHSNWATFGAGAYILAYFGTVNNKIVHFYNCTWKENRAFYSPAIDIAPSGFEQHNIGSLPIPVFRDCNFINNKIERKSNHNNNSYTLTVGVFVITRFTVIFEGTMLFDHNVFSAVLVNSGQIVVEPNSKITFTNNTGLRGGAISLYSFSSIQVSDNCTLEFFNNTAMEYGGAIFKHTLEPREFFAGRSCFLKYTGKREVPVNERNINFIFIGNKAAISGSSIFASSFHSCYFSNRGSLEEHRLEEFLADIGNFTFDTNSTTSEFRVPTLGTTTAEFINDKGHNIIHSIPGMGFSLLLTVVDELNQTHQSDFFTRVDQDNSNITIDSPYSVSNSITAYGTPNEKATLIITTKTTHRILEYTLVIQMLPCPPGFYLDENTSKPSCKCSANVKEQAFLGITRCNHDQNNFTAVIQSGYWAGYYNDSDTLYIAVCPYEFCSVNTEYGREYSLPNTTAALSSFICRSNRKGVLCAECNEGQSMYFHSRILTCGPEDKCSYGILFYILTELIPVVIFFTTVIVFDISFTTGERNGFIFFSQMVIILPLEFHKYDLKPAQLFQSGYNLLYRIFNIDFFTIESLSFCLFKDTTVLELLAFKYVTMIFAFIFIIVVVLVIKYCTCCSKPCSIIKRKMTAKTSVLHGLSALIILCYAQCIRISFFILRKTTLLGPGGTKGPIVVFNAGIDYFNRKHIPYAIPAILSLGTIAVIPPVLLLVYPSVLKVLQLCKLSEHRLVTATLRVTRINYLLPMFDVFQSCFKDKFRFFAGLYFFYRIALLASYAFSTSHFQIAVVSELILLLIFCVHCISQPYKLRTHNIIDSLLIFDLAVIVMINIVLLKDSPTSNDLIPALVYLQLLLIYTPMAVFLTFCVVRLFQFVHRVHIQKKDEDTSDHKFIEYLDSVDRSIDESTEMNEFQSSYTQCNVSNSVN